MSNLICYVRQYAIDEYPQTCAECPFSGGYHYHDNAYEGTAYLCELGYMDTGDTREFDIQRKRWPNCDIEHNDRVVIWRRGL